jgi:regulator of sigma E protease
VVRSIDGKPVDDWSDITQAVILSTGTRLEFVVQRAGREVSLTATPRRGVIYDALGRAERLGKLGLVHVVQPGEPTVRHFTLPQAVGAASQRIVSTITTTLTYVKRLVTGRENADQLAGPLGMAQLSHDLAEKTAEVSPDLSAFAINILVGLTEMVGAISVGTGFMNLLPVPVLDGGHLLFYAYEAVARRPLDAKVQAAGYRVGLALVLGLMLFATWNDLQRLRVFHLFGGLFS